MEVLSQVGDEVRGAGEEDYVYCLRALTNLAKRADRKGVRREMWEQLCRALGDPWIWGPNLMTEARRVLKVELQRPQLRDGGQPSSPGDQGVVPGRGERRDGEMGGHPLAQVDGADDSGPQGLQTSAPQSPKIPHPEGKRLPESDTDREEAQEQHGSMGVLC